MNEPLVSKRTGRNIVVSRPLSVINVGNGLEVEVHRGVNGPKREHGEDVCEENPVRASALGSIGGTEDRAQTLEEQDDDDPVENSADEESGEISLLREVEPVWDLGSVGVVGEWSAPIASHY